MERNFPRIRNPEMKAREEHYNSLIPYQYEYPLNFCDISNDCKKVAESSPIPMKIAESPMNRIESNPSSELAPTQVG